MKDYKQYPRLTLFMLISLDGKISSGDVDVRDFDKDLPLVKGVREGLRQYYDIEKTTDIFSLNTGRVMEKIGVNSRRDEPKKMSCSFIIIDNKPHLDEKGIDYLCRWTRKLFLVTINSNHPALKMKRENLEVIKFDRKINFNKLFKTLKLKHGVNRITVQSGGTLNAELLRNGFIDHVSVVVAPCLVGGCTTSTIVDGLALRSLKDLEKIKTLKIIKCEKLKNSYVYLKYDVLN